VLTADLLLQNISFREAKWTKLDNKNELLKTITIKLVFVIVIGDVQTLTIWPKDA